MFISRTPFRVSLFGGGSDIPKYFLERGGEVLSFTINKYCYVSTRIPSNVIEHNLKVAYSKIEVCQKAQEIEHPLIRTALLDFRFPTLELHYDSDLPANSGLGTSSSFAVGMANCLYAHRGEFPTKKILADKAIYWERERLRENGGYQDQIAASYGGVNHITFHKNNTYQINNFNISSAQKKSIEDRILIFYIPIKRFSNNHSVQKYLNEKETIDKVSSIKSIVKESINALVNENYDQIGELLNISWQYKKSIKNVSNDLINEIYNTGISAGALGGKILGAGGGGFILFWCKEGEKNIVAQKLSSLSKIDFSIEKEGSKLIYKD